MYLDFVELLAILNAHKVRYLVVGGYAVSFHAQPRATKDLDLLVQPDLPNATALYRALAEFGAPFDNLTPGDFSEPGSFLRMGTPPLMVDILPEISGVDFDAAWSRRVDAPVDLVTIHETILPLGAVIAAAVGKFPGTTPEEMLAEITRHSRFTAAEFQALATDRPIDVRDLHRRIRGMIEQAERFIAGLPTDAIGVVFLDGDKPVQPDLAALGDYRRISGAPRGVWPSSPDISSAMLDRDNKPSPG